MTAVIRIVAIVATLSLLAACGAQSWTYRPGGDNSLATDDSTMGPHG